MVIEVEGEETRDGDEERIIAVEEVIVLDEGMRGSRRGRGRSGRRRIGVKE